MWRLHDHGADLHSKNEYGGSLLMSAVHYGLEADVTALLAAGLDVNAVNNRGDTPLSLAAAKGNLDVLKMLLSHGATHGAYLACHARHARNACNAAAAHSHQERHHRHHHDRWPRAWLPFPLARFV